MIRVINVSLVGHIEWPLVRVHTKVAYRTSLIIGRVPTLCVDFDT